MYDASAALQAIDSSAPSIMACLLITAAFAFLYFFIALKLAARQKVYVVPFIPTALFFWHDLSFVLLYDRWFHVFNHWWVKMWWFALVGTVFLELALLYQVYRYGQKELWPGLSKRTFGLLIVLATLGIGALWLLVKASINDDLFFITFAITAVFSVPFHSALMSRRQSRQGQSVIMQLCAIIMLLSMTAAFAQISPFFSTPTYQMFVLAFCLWPLANIWLMSRLPATSRKSLGDAKGAVLLRP